MKVLAVEAGPQGHSGTPASLSPLRNCFFERLERLLPLSLFVVYLLDVSLRARLRHLWFDELITFHVARLPSLSQIWEALSQTADGQPPLQHLLVRAAHFFFGSGEIATRLPFILAFAVMSWALYRFVGKRAGPIYGLAATLLVWTTWAYEYAYEARPYALVMGACGMSLLFWRAAVEGKHRRWALAGLGLSLIAALSSQYYAGLIFVPLVAGELVRTFRRKAIDVPLWGTLAVASSSLLFYLPLALGIRNEYQGGFWSPVQWVDFIGFYLYLLAPAALPLLLIAAVAGAGYWLSSRDLGKRNSVLALMPAHEWAALWALALLPVLYVLIALVATRALVYRYPLPAVFGICALIALGIRGAAGNDRRVGWATVAVLACAFVGMRLVPTLSRWGEPTPRERLASVFDHIEAATARFSDPIVIAVPHLYPVYMHYAPEGLRERFVYPADPEAARKFTETDSPDVSLLKLAPWAGYRVIPYESFREQQPNFYIVQRQNHRFEWIAKQLRTEGESLKVVYDDPLDGVLRCCEDKRALHAGSSG